MDDRPRVPMPRVVVAARKRLRSFAMTCLPEELVRTDGEKQVQGVRPVHPVGPACSPRAVPARSGSRCRAAPVSVVVGCKRRWASAVSGSARRGVRGSRTGYTHLRAKPVSTATLTRTPHTTAVRSRRASKIGYESGGTDGFAVADDLHIGDDELPHLNTFSVAAELSSFTKAAKALGLTQAAVSQRIQTLEQSLDTSLFDRRG